MSTFGSKMIIFPGHNANRKIQNLRTSQRYIFLILQQFTTKLCNFTHLKMFFPAMVMDFVLLVQIKISSIAGIIHYHGLIDRRIKSISRINTPLQMSRNTKSDLKRLIKLFKKCEYFGISFFTSCRTPHCTACNLHFDKTNFNLSCRSCMARHLCSKDFFNLARMRPCHTYLCCNDFFN